MTQHNRCRAAPNGTALLDEPSDEELLQRFRAGDEAAFEELYRRHEPVARKAASCLVRSRVDTHDVVADAFMRVLAILRRGGGPDAAFRPYLLACVRNAAYDRSGRRSRETPSDDLPPEDIEGDDPVEAAEDNDLVLAALQTLPERWRLVLWYTAVEGRKPADVAEQLDLTPNGVAALAYRARDGLREAYLQAHLQHRAPDGCRDTVARLGAHVRGSLSRRDRRPVDAHLAGCAQCRALVRELRDVDRRLHTVFLPAAGGLPAVFTFLSRVGAGASRFAERAGEIAAGITAPVAVGAAVAGVAVTGAVGVAVTQRDEPTVVVAAGAPDRFTDTDAGADTGTTASTPTSSATTTPTTAGSGTPGSLTPATTPATAPATAGTGQPPATPSASVEPPTITVAATTPGVTVTVPPVVTTVVSVPAVTLPTISVSLPPVSLPALSVPPITVPDVPVPVVSTLPALPQLQVQGGLQGLALPGLEARLMVAVTNTGTAASQGTQVNLPLPAGLAFVTASGPGWSCGGGATVSCQLPDLGPGSSTSATIRVRVGLLVSGILRVVPVVDATNAVAVTGPALALAIGG